MVVCNMAIVQLFSWVFCLLAIATSAPTADDAPSNGKRCPPGFCCSKYGYCGNTLEHCSSGCQVNWGQCDHIRVIRNCVVPNTVAITFDDGPYKFTSWIAKKFSKADGRVTFFMNGINYGCIYDHADAVRDAYNAGHQIGSHTWSHGNLTILSEAEVSTEMNKLSTAFQKIIGAVPVYVRPPYGSYNDQTLSVLQNLGFKVFALWDLDSRDSLRASIAQQMEVFISASEDVSHITLQHDTNKSNVENMVPFVIAWAKQRNLKMVTVGECLGDPSENWYKDYITPKSEDRTWHC